MCYLISLYSQVPNLDTQTFGHRPEIFPLPDSWISYICMNLCCTGERHLPRDYLFYSYKSLEWLRLTLWCVCLGRVQSEKDNLERYVHPFLKEWGLL